MDRPSPRLRPATSDAKKHSLWYHLHFWIGWIAAIPIAVVCLTGGLLVFEVPIFQWEHRDHFQLDISGTPLSVQQALDTYRAADPPLVVNHLTLPSGPEQSYSAYVTELRPEGNRAGRVFLNPYTGELTWLEATFSIAESLIDVHRHLAAGRMGQLVVAVSSLVLVVTFLFGLILWWPLRGRTFVRAWKRGQALDWHNALGLVALLPLAVMATTGIIFTWGPSLWSLLDRMEGPPAPTTAEAPAMSAGGIPISMDLILERIRSTFPDAQFTGVQPGGGAPTPVKVFLAADGQQWQLAVDPSSGAELSRSDGSATGPLDWVRRNFGAIHTLGPFGLGIRVIWGLLSIAGTVLVGTGLWISIRRWRRPTHQNAMSA